jgi:hypothetical protein
MTISLELILRATTCYQEETRFFLIALSHLVFSAATSIPRTYGGSRSYFSNKTNKVTPKLYHHLNNHSGQTPLHYALTVCRASIAKSILEVAQKCLEPEEVSRMINTPDVNGDTAVFSAIRCGDQEIVNLLVQAGMWRLRVFKEEGTQNKERQGRRDKGRGTKDGGTRTEGQGRRDQGGGTKNGGTRTEGGMREGLAGRDGGRAY